MDTVEVIQRLGHESKNLKLSRGPVSVPQRSARPNGSRCRKSAEVRGKKCGMAPMQELCEPTETWTAAVSSTAGDAVTTEFMTQCGDADTQYFGEAREETKLKKDVPGAETKHERPDSGAGAGGWAAVAGQLCGEQSGAFRVPLPRALRRAHRGRLP